VNLATLGAEGGNRVHDLSFLSTFSMAQGSDKHKPDTPKIYSLNVPSFQ
jgi:hypothetical protein